MSAKTPRAYDTFDRLSLPHSHSHGAIVADEDIDVNPRGMGRWAWRLRGITAVGMVMGMAALLPWLLMHSMKAASITNEASSLSSTSTDSSETLPHVIFLLADDLAWIDVSDSTHKWSELTPFMDKLMYGGVRMTRYYTQQICTPARAALLTGKYPIHNGMQHDVIQVDGRWGLRLSEKLMSQHMLSLGYQTALIGKWHLGHFSEEYLPTNRGFEEFYGYLSGMEFYYQHKQTFELNNTRYYDFLEAKGKEYSVTQDKNTYGPVLFHERAAQLLSDRGSDPLFLLMSFQNVHSPLDDPPSYMISDSQLEFIESLGNPFERGYARSLVALDWSVQKIYEELEANDMLHNSMIVFASDNGGCSLGGGFNYPLRGDKVSLFEGGVRVNSFVWAAGKDIVPSAAKGTTYDNLFHVTDWLPTIVYGALGRTDVDLSVIDGVDQWAAMTLTSTEVPRTEILLNVDNYAGNTNTQRGIIVNSMKLIYDYDIGYFEPEYLDVPETAMNESYSLIDCILGESSDFRVFVFNLDDDPYEQSNLASTISSTLFDTLSERLQSYIDTQTEPCWVDELSNADAGPMTDEYAAMLGLWDNQGGIVPWASDSTMACEGT